MGCSQSKPSPLSAKDSSDGVEGEGFSIPSQSTREAILDAHPDEKWFESSPDYQYVDELDAYQDSNGRTLRKVAPSAAAEQFFWGIPLMGKSWDMYRAHVPATAVLLLGFAAWIGVFCVPYTYNQLQEPYPGGAKFCYGAVGLANGTAPIVLGTEVYVTETQMCTVTNQNTTETITESGSLPLLEIKDVHDIINTAWIPTVAEDAYDITGYFFKGTPSTSQNLEELTLASNNKWAWSNRLFYFGLPSEWYLLFTAGLLSPNVQCFELTLKSTTSCPANSVGIRTITRSAPTTTDITTTTWDVGASHELGYIAGEIGDGSTDWPQELIRATDGGYYVRDYKWGDEPLIALAFILPILMGILGAFAITTATIVAVRYWLKHKRTGARGKFKQLMEYGSVALGTNGSFICRIVKDDGPGKSAGPKGKIYAKTVARLLKAWGCTQGKDPEGKPLYIQQFMTDDEASRDKKLEASRDKKLTVVEAEDEKQFLTRDMEEMLHEFYVIDAFNNVVGIRSIVHHRDWEDRYRDDKRMWLLQNIAEDKTAKIPETVMGDCKKSDGTNYDGRIDTSDEVRVLKYKKRKLNKEEAEQIITMAKRNNKAAREFICSRNEEYTEAVKRDGSTEKMDAWLAGVDVDKRIPSRFDMVRAFNDVPFLCCPISARESSLVRAVRSQQADGSTPDDEDISNIRVDEIQTEYTSEELDEIASLSRHCDWRGCQGSGSTWYITKQQDGFDSNPTCAYGPMLFIEFLSAKLIEFFFSFLQTADTNTPVFLDALPKLRQELVKASEDPKLTAEQKADYQVMKVKQLLQTSEDPILRRKTVKAIINFKHSESSLDGLPNPRANERVLIDFPSSHYLPDGQAVPGCQAGRPKEQHSPDVTKAYNKATGNAKDIADTWWAAQLVERDTWRETKKESCCAGATEKNGPQKSQGKGTYETDNFDAGQPSWTAEERQTVIDRRVASLAMSPAFYLKLEDKPEEKQPTQGRPSCLPEADGKPLYLKRNVEQLGNADSYLELPGWQPKPGFTGHKYMADGGKPHESSYLASMDICSNEARFLDPADPKSINGYAALLKKSSVQRLKDFVEYPNGRGFMAEAQQGILDFAKGWITREVFSVLMMCLLLIGSCAVLFVGVIAMAMWDHDEEIGYKYAELILIPGYLLAVVCWHELHAYYDHGMEFHFFRKVMRNIMQVLMAINCWLTVWYVIVTGLWMILGCIVNPDVMSPYGMATGAFSGVAISAYATFQQKKDEITKIIMDFVDEYLKDGINVPVTAAAERVLAGLPAFPEAVDTFLNEAQSLINQADSDKENATGQLESLQALQDFCTTKGVQLEKQWSSINFGVHKALINEYKITDPDSLKVALAKKQEFVTMLTASLEEIKSAEIDCKGLKDCLKKDPSIPEPGTEILAKLNKLQHQGQALRHQGAEAAAELSDNVAKKQANLSAQIGEAEDKANARITEAKAALQNARDEYMHQTGENFEKAEAAMIANNQEAVDKTKENFQGAADATKRNAKLTEEETKQNAKRALAKAKAIFTDAEDKANEIKNKAIKSLEHAETLLIGSVTKEADNMRKEVEANVLKTQSAIKDARNRVTNQVNDAAEIGRRAAAEVQAITQKVKEFFSEGEAIKDIQHVVFEWLGLSPAGLIIALLGALIFLGGCCAFVFIGAAAFLGESTGTVIQSALIAAFGIVSAVVDKSKQEEKSDKAEDGCTNLVKDLIEQQAKAIIGKLTAAMDDQLSGMYAIMADAEACADASVNLVHDLKNEAVTHAQDLKSAGEAMVEDTVAFGVQWQKDAIDVSMGFKDQAEGAVQAVVDTATEGVERAKDIGQETFEEQKRIGQQAVEEQERIGQKTFADQKQIGEEYVDNQGDTIQEAAGNQVDITLNSANNLKETGQDLGNGVLQDVKDTGGAMAETVQEGGTDAAKTVEKFSVSAAGTGTGTGMVVIDMVENGSQSSIGRGAGTGTKAPLTRKEKDEKRKGSGRSKFAIYSSNLARNNPEKFGNIRQQVAMTSHQTVIKETVQVFSDPMLKKGDPRIDEIKTVAYGMDSQIRELRNLISDHDMTSEFYKGNLMFRMDRLEAMCSAPRQQPRDWRSSPSVVVPSLVELSDGAPPEGGIPSAAPVPSSAEQHGVSGLQL